MKGDTLVVVLFAFFIGATCVEVDQTQNEGNDLELYLVVKTFLRFYSIKFLIHKDLRLKIHSFQNMQLNQK